MRQGSDSSARRSSRHVVSFLMFICLWACTFAGAQAGGVQLDCSRLPGSGSYSDPLQLGTISRNTVVVGCPPLTSGRGFNLRYFSFSVPFTLPAGAAIGTAFVAAQGSAVHPRLVGEGGVTLLRSGDGQWLSTADGQTLRVLPLGGLTPGGYRFGAEKLSSPSGGLQTAPYHILILVRP